MTASEGRDEHRDDSGSQWAAKGHARCLSPLTDPQLPAAKKTAMVLGDPGAIARGEVRNLELDLGDIVARVFEVDDLDRHEPRGRDMDPAGGRKTTESW